VQYGLIVKPAVQITNTESNEQTQAVRSHNDCITQQASNLKAAISYSVRLDTNTPFKLRASVSPLFMFGTSEESATNGELVEAPQADTVHVIVHRVHVLDGLATGEQAVDGLVPADHVGQLK